MNLADPGLRYLKKLLSKRLDIYRGGQEHSQLFPSNFGGRNFDALRYFWKKPTNGIFENGQKSTSEAKKSFLEADFDFFWTKVPHWR